MIHKGKTGNFLCLILKCFSPFYFILCSIQHLQLIALTFLRDRNINTVIEIPNTRVQNMSLCMRKPTIWVPTRSDTNCAVQAQKQARGWKFWILEEAVLYYPCSENKGADQLHSYCKADLRLCFRICKLCNLSNVYNFVRLILRSTNSRSGKLPYFRQMQSLPDQGSTLTYPSKTLQGIISSYILFSVCVPCRIYECPNNVEHVTITGHSNCFLCLASVVRLVLGFNFGRKKTTTKQ